MTYIAVKTPGRPPTWDTPEQLQKLIDEYFLSCLSPIMENIENPEYDAEKAKEYGEDYDISKKIRVQKTDGAGNPIYEQIEPFTITGLARSIGTSRNTLLEYEKELLTSMDENLRKQFAHTIKEAKRVVEEYLEKYMYTGKNQTSAIFVAKNNFGWIDRRETDLTTKGDKLEGNVITFAKQDGQAS